MVTLQKSDIEIYEAKITDKTIYLKYYVIRTGETIEAIGMRLD